MKKIKQNQHSASLLPLLTVGFAVLGIYCTFSNFKLLTLLASAVTAALLFLCPLKRLRSVPVILLLGYVVFAGFSIFWAMSGKFQLREYSKIVLATAIFLFILLKEKFDTGSAKCAMCIISGMSTIYALLSVEAASTGIVRKLLNGMPGVPSNLGFTTGSRMEGIFGAPNPTATMLAFGMIFAIALLCAEEQARLRSLYAGMLAINAFAFLLLFSMGGTGCFAIAVVVYLICAGERRNAVLLRMLEAAVPTLICVFLAFPFFNRAGMGFVPLVVLAGDVAIVAVLEKFLAPKLLGVLEAHGKLALGVLVGVIALAVIYVVAGYNLSGAYTFSGETLERSAYPAAGEHTLTIASDGAVNVHIYSRNTNEAILRTHTTLYEGTAENATFIVPENSEVCYFAFTAPEGTTLTEAKIDGKTTVHLKYTLLPAFIANRLQGLWANSNVLLRYAHYRDGLRVFALSPIVGNGVGSFETGITRVQEFFFETKYVHNHYIQVLLENGVIGFVLFVGALLTMAYALWRRRKETEWEYGWAYGALWSAFAMTVTHMAFEVSMSIAIFLCYAYVLFALILRICPWQLPERSAEPVESKKKKKALPQGEPVALHLVCALFPLLFALSLVGNLAANAMMKAPAESPTGFLNSCATAAKIDLYERNDAKLSYVVTVGGERIESCVAQANEYAAELMEVPSNSIPRYLTVYYLQTMQSESAVKAALNGAKYSASDAETWNANIATLRYYLFGTPESPLFADDRIMLDGMLKYYAVFCERNEASMEPIQLTAESTDFFARILALDVIYGDMTKMYEIILTA